MSGAVYEVNIGLEVHAELKTATKIFCACPTTFGAPPNTLCCPICLGLPGTLPTLNRQAVVLAVRAGLALECEIARLCRTDRKHYFYPDLPKAYQISQERYPLCKNGRLTVGRGETAREIAIVRIHIEEDAGKLIHKGEKTLVDCNRCGVPLIEIVTAPELHSPKEAGDFLKELRRVLVACRISDCKMEEGSLRCDVNVSLRRVGETAFGTRVEIKNINSFAFVEKAIAYEIERQTAILSEGGVLQTETRRFDATLGKTLPMRGKEGAADYRYLAEPDLPAISLAEADIQAIRDSLPELPRARAARLIESFAIAEADADILVSSAALATYFEQAAEHTSHYAILSGLLLTEVLRIWSGDDTELPILPARLAAVAEMMGERRINSAVAKRLVFRLSKEDFDPEAIVVREGLGQICDREALLTVVDRILKENPKAVSDYLGGKLAALRALQGKGMAMTQGLADPVLLEEILIEQLSM